MISNGIYDARGKLIAQANEDSANTLPVSSSFFTEQNSNNPAIDGTTSSAMQSMIFRGDIIVKNRKGDSTVTITRDGNITVMKGGGITIKDGGGLELLDGGVIRIQGGALVVNDYSTDRVLLGNILSL